MIGRVYTQLWEHSLAISVNKRLNIDAVKNRSNPFGLLDAQLHRHQPVLLVHRDDQVTCMSRTPFQRNIETPGPRRQLLVESKSVRVMHNAGNTREPGCETSEESAFRCVSSDQIKLFSTTQVPQIGECDRVEWTDRFHPHGRSCDS